MQTPPSTFFDHLRNPERGPDWAVAWDAFLVVCVPLLLSYVKTRGVRGADAEDVTQTILLNLVKSLPSYQNKQGRTFHQWLLTIARNECATFFRRSRRVNPGLEGLAETEDDGAPPELDAIEEREYRLRLAHQGLKAIRKHFDDTTWAAFRGAVLDLRPAAEVAAELGIDARKVHDARYRVLRRLRDELNVLND